MKRSGLKFQSTASSAEDGPVGKAVKMQEELFMAAVAECTDFPSFTKRPYPCWVISLTNLAALDELPHHEGSNSRCIVRPLHVSIPVASKRSLPTAAPLFRRRRRITKIASSSSKNYSLTAQARRVRLASSSRKTGKVAGRVHPVMGSTMCAVPLTPTTSSTPRYCLVVSFSFEP